MDTANLFEARDDEYLRAQQYGTTEKLNARVALHAKYSTSDLDWFQWLRAQIEWSNVESLLEVGCGTGEFWSESIIAMNANTSVVLTDLSPIMVTTALSKARRHVQRVHGLEADVQSLPFRDDAFDSVIANQVLYHAKDPAKALDEIHRVLKPGGVLAASTIGPDHLRELFDIESVAFGARRPRTHADVFGRVTGREVIDKTFENVRWLQFDDRLRCTDTDDVVEYLTSTPPGENATPKELQRLRTEIERRMNENQGTLEVSKDCGLFLANASE